jgi:hypothetical protein
MSQGLFLEISAEGAGPGETARPRDGQLAVRLRVAGAAWAAPTRVDLFLNGNRVHTEPLAAADGPCDHRLEIALAAPAHDAWLVALAQGPAPAGGWWTTLQTHLAALSNPILVEAEGDGVWRSPREIAATLLAAAADGAALGASLAGHDRAVAAQAATLWRRRSAASAAPADAEALCAHAGAHEAMLRRLLLDPAALR